MSRRRRRRPRRAAPARSPAQMTYAELRALNPAAARQKVLEAFESLGSFRAVAVLFETDRKTVRKAIRRFRVNGVEGLTDLSRRPHHSPNQTSPALEQLVVAARRQTGYGPLRLNRDAEVPLPPGTIRNVLRRHPVRPKKRKTWRGTRIAP